MTSEQVVTSQTDFLQADEQKTEQCRWFHQQQLAARISWSWVHTQKGRQMLSDAPLSLSQSLEHTTWRPAHRLFLIPLVYCSLDHSQSSTCATPESCGTELYPLLHLLKEACKRYWARGSGCHWRMQGDASAQCIMTKACSQHWHKFNHKWGGWGETCIYILFFFLRIPQHTQKSVETRRKNKQGQMPSREMEEDQVAIIQPIL